MSEFVTFFLSELYSVESGYVNSPVTAMIHHDEIQSVIKVPQRFKSYPAKYFVTLKCGKEYLSVDNRLDQHILKFGKQK